MTVTGGTLAGTGNIAGAITLNDGSIAPGNSSNEGILATAQLPILMTGGMSFNLSSGTVNASQLNVTAAGNINLGTALTLSVTPFNWSVDPSFFRIISTTGTTFNDQFAAFPKGSTVFTNTMTSFFYQIHYGTFPGEAGNVVLASVVPEPMTIVALVGGVAPLARRHRTSN